MVLHFKVCNSTMNDTSKEVMKIKHTQTCCSIVLQGETAVGQSNAEGLWC